MGADSGIKKPVIPVGPAKPYTEWTDEDEDIDNGRLVALKALSGESTNGTATPTSSTYASTPTTTTTDFATPAGAKTLSNGKTDLTHNQREPRGSSSSQPNMGSFVTRGEGSEANGDIDPARKLDRKKTTTYESENAKWYKAAKKAEKKEGTPYVHLAL